MNIMGNEHEYSEEDGLFYEDMADEEGMNTLAIQQLLEDDTEMLMVDRERIRTKRRKKERKRRKRSPSVEKKSTGQRRVVNLPASQPTIRTIDGEQRLCFKYNTKVCEDALTHMPRAELEENEFCVRFELDTVDVTKLNEKFKMDNCIYPRANVPYEMYCGNRWEYETECNKLAWQFVALNPVLLYGKKGLIQRAVDSYRNINKHGKGRKVVKQEQEYDIYVNKRASEHSPKTTTISWTLKGITKKCKIRIDIENVDYNKVDRDFKHRYSVFSDIFDQNSFGLDHWESNNPDNIISVKIAFLNIDNTAFWNAVKATDKNIMLKKAVMAYKMKLENPNLQENNDDLHDHQINLNDFIASTNEGNHDETEIIFNQITSNDTEIK